MVLERTDVVKPVVCDMGARRPAVASFRMEQVPSDAERNQQNNDRQVFEQHHDGVIESAKIVKKGDPHFFSHPKTIFQMNHRYKTEILKQSNMATMTISYDGRSKLARSVVDLIRSLDVFTIIEQPASKGSYHLSQEDIRAGRVETFASSSDMFQSLGI